MFAVLILTLALAAAATVGTIRAVHLDGYRRTPADPRRLP